MKKIENGCQDKLDCSTASTLTKFYFARNF